jgi:hypothetical protein
VGSDEHLVLKGNALIDRNAVLYLHSVAHADILVDVDSLGQNALPANDSTFANLCEVPHTGTRADACTLSDYRGGMDEHVRVFGNDTA